MLICIPRPGPGPRQGPPRGNYHANSAPEKYYLGDKLSHQLFLILLETIDRSSLEKTKKCAKANILSY